MDYRAIVKSKTRLEIAKRELNEATAALNYADFANSWYLFLVSYKSVFTLLEQGSKSDARSRQWFGSKKEQRRTDELIQYLYQARNDAEHGLGDVTKHESISIGFGKAAPGHSLHMSVSVKSDSQGNWTLTHAESHDGLPILVEERDNAALLPIKGRGKDVFSVPSVHLGNVIVNATPYEVGRLGILYLENLINEAEQKCREIG